MKNRFKKVREKLKMVVMIAGITLMHMNVNVYASGIKSTKLYSGGLKLIKDLTTVAMGFLGAYVVYREVTLFIQRADAKDNEKAVLEKEMKNIVVLGILGETVGGVLQVVFAYFK